MSSNQIPRHIAIIMDGNGRWAHRRGYARPWGHRSGARRVDQIVTACCELGVEYLTLYAFSTENWLRPQSEISLLMRLLVRHLRKLDRKLVENRVALTVQGQIDRLPEFVRLELDRVVALTALEHPALTLCLCLSYGGREEIVEAARSLALEVKRGSIEPVDIDEAVFAKHLYRPLTPDPDLLIRTGGELRVSNFLLWQIAYTEIVVSQKLWPDFTRADLDAALDQFSKRQRRFGMTSTQITVAEESVEISGGVAP